MISVGQARPGDVVLDAQGKCWRRGEEFSDWSTFDGPVYVFGAWDASYGPQGDLTLLARDGKRA